MSKQIAGCSGTFDSWLCFGRETGRLVSPRIRRVHIARMLTHFVLPALNFARQTPCLFVVCKHALRSASIAWRKPPGRHLRGNYEEIQPCTMIRVANLSRFFEIVSRISGSNRKRIRSPWRRSDSGTISKSRDKTASNIISVPR